MERLEKLRDVSPEKQELLQLEQEGNYVFHGTYADLDSLDPRQAVDVEKGPDRLPAIFASPKADYAIFHAIIHGQNTPGVTSQSGAISYDDGSFDLKFALPKPDFDQIPESASGMVYVFEKRDFAPIEGRPAEYESHIAATPYKKIRVTKKDLPGYITFV